jgi:hypothetical protein
MITARRRLVTGNKAFDQKAPAAACDDQRLRRSPLSRHRPQRATSGTGSPRTLSRGDGEVPLWAFLSFLSFVLEAV